MRTLALLLALLASADGRAVEPGGLDDLRARILARDDDPSGFLLPNFHRVSEGIYRSGQPSRSGISELKRLGVRSVLNLRARTRAAERDQLRKLGMNSVHVPIHSGKLSYQAIDDALGKLADPALRPISVHCRFGKDRTGYVIAAYRVVIEGWSVNRAAEEAEKLGCCAGNYPKIRPYLEGYRKHRSEKP